jgi:ribosomal protein L32
MRHTRAHTANRRSHHALSEAAISNDAQDGLHMRHRVSPITGKYKGEQVLDLNKKVSKKSETKEEEK